MDVWSQIGYLAGQTLKTLGRHKPFEIMSVSPDDVRIYIYTSLKKRRIKRSEIESAWQELQSEGQLTNSDIKARHSKVSPTYISSILAVLPGVWYKTGPIRLYYD